MIENFFQSLSSSFKKSSFDKESIGHKVFNSKEITEDSVVLFSIEDEFTEVRKSFYALSDHFGSTGIIDLGVFKKTSSAKNNLTGLKEVMLELSELKAKTIVLSNSSEFVLAQWMASVEMRGKADLSIVIPSYSSPVADYLFQIFENEYEKLFHISFVALQSYFNKRSIYETLDKFFFEELRIGEFREDKMKMEALVREADFMAFDVSAIKNSDFSAGNINLPNGLYNEEACQITRFAGLSNCSDSISFLEIDEKKLNNISAQQLAQMMWYYVEGVENRFNEVPDVKDDTFQVLHCPIENTPVSEILFLKNLLNERLWMQVPDGDSHRWIGCSDEEYLVASLGEIPEKWFRAAGI